MSKQTVRVSYSDVRMTFDMEYPSLSEAEDDAICQLESGLAIRRAVILKDGNVSLVLEPVVKVVFRIRRHS